ncbi:MAG: type II toxin-antitoxin system death-on-curing family toxin [Acidobacteria bacterium]|nr:type II toxin-antitoxin system death-on-curing family toxin [Acidobacteriota bacterium]
MTEPIFLTRAQVDELHHDSIERHGGTHGIRNEHGLESAVAQPMNVYYYGGGDLCEIAAGYAFHIAESQAYLDGNKRAAILAAMVFLEINGCSTELLSEDRLYDAMIQIANHELDRAGLAAIFRSTLG